MRISIFSRAVLLAWLATGCAACGESESWPEVDAPDALGPYSVGHEKFTELDADREDRSLLIDVWYPADRADAIGAEKTSYELVAFIGLESEVAVEAVPVSDLAVHPLLVFSHGYGGINIQSIDLMEALASHGFVIASVEHTGNAQSSMTDTFEEAAANRVPDVSFVIDVMLARNSDGQDLFHQRMDETRIGVVGHSFGGMTAVGIAAGWAGADPDPRVLAIAPISAVIDGDLQQDDRPSPSAGFDEQELAGIHVPVMLIGGTADVSVPIANNQIAFDQMVNAPDLYKVDIIGANHTHFAGVCDIGDMLIEMGLEQDSWEGMGAGDLIAPYEATCSQDAFPIEEATRLLNLYAVAFFKLHLMDESGYGRYLTAGYAKDEPAIGFSVLD